MQPSPPDLLGIIQPKTVKTALENLLYTSNARTTSMLEQLTLVDQTLAHMSGGKQHRRYGLKEVLTTLITDQYFAHRQVVDLSPPPELLTCESAMQRVQEDIRSGHHELICWSWLYYHFVRFELPISGRVFSEWCNFDRRTLHRHFRHALRRLTEILIDAEREAQQKAWKNYLYARLPLSFPVTLVGHQLARMQLQHLPRSEYPRHVLIIGEEGIGKTAVVQEAIRQQIEVGDIGHLIWITGPASIAEIQQQLAGWSGITDDAVSLKQYTLSNPLTLVVDGIDDLLGSPASVHELLATLGASRLYLTARRYVSLNMVQHVALRPLKQTETRTLSALFARLYNLENEIYSEDIQELIWEQSGGNPRRIRESILSLRNERDT